MYKAKLVDRQYYEDLIPCRQACPVKTDACGYVAAAGAGNMELAFTIARQTNPFVQVCGRVCGAPCEDACRRGFIDSPVAIRPIKRAACDFHDPALGHFPFQPPKKSEGGRIKVAVLGAGPAGLAAAHDLALMGYAVTIFETRSIAGGMLHLGIPEYRLPRGLIRYEVGAILELGVELKTNIPIGGANTLSGLAAQGFEAIFIGVGCHKGRQLDIEGRSLDGVFTAVEYLLNINLGFKVDLGGRVAVIGGGDVAMDVARTAMRPSAGPRTISPAVLKELQLQKIEISDEAIDAMKSAVDVARTAVRGAARDVHLFSLEGQHEMPAHDFEIEEAQVEGVVFHPRRSPQKIVGENGRVVGLVTVAVASVFDAEGRFAPTFVPDSAEFTPVDSVVLAVGQTPDLSFMTPEDGIEINAKGSIAVDPVTLMTTKPGVFAGGDVAFGPRLIIDAVAHGQKAAAGINKFLTGRTRSKSRLGKMRQVPNATMPWHYLSNQRQPVPSRPSDRRIGFAEVETGYTREEAIREAERCLRCEINTVFDSEKCVMCGGCVDICPYNCLKIVTPDQLDLDAEGARVAEHVFGLPWEEIKLHGAKLGGVIIKDEELCVRCGLCADRCPQGAITMEVFESEETSYEH